MRQAITLRLGQAADATAIATLSRDYAEAGLPWIFTPRRVLASVRDRATNVLVACENERVLCACGTRTRTRGAQNRVVGAGIMRHGRGDAYLELLVVRPETRGLGLGRRMLEWLERPAVLGGASVVWLEVRASNAGAREFYRRLGYRQVAELPGYYAGRESAIRMGRELDAP